MTQPSIRLVMVVKDEAHVIRRCLESVKPLINSYYIVIDDSTTDNTEGVIRETFGYMSGSNISGGIYRRPWVNYGVNRSEAIQLACRPPHGSDYLLMMDADDILEGSWPSNWDRAADTFELKVNYNGISYWRPQIFRNDGSYKYIGAVHEYLTRGETSAVVSRLHGLTLKIVGGGSSWQDPDKYKKHAELCLAELKQDPTNTRAAFYLAQSLKDAEMLEKALQAYYKRVDMRSGFAEEIYISLLEIGRLNERINSPDSVTILAYEAARQFRPMRVEAHRELARFYRSRHRWAEALKSAKTGYETIFHHHSDSLFVEDDWKIIDEYALAAFYSHKVLLAKELNEGLLVRDDLPSDQRSRVQANLYYCITDSSHKPARLPGLPATMRCQFLDDSGGVLYSFDHKLGDTDVTNPR